MLRQLFRDFPVRTWLTPRRHQRLFPLARTFWPVLEPEHQDAVKKLAARLGIERHLQKYPGQLSVGERQRVAIARALAHEPAVVIADEPTASLDPINAEEIMGIFTRIAGEKGVTFIVATHEWERVKELGFRRVKFNLERDAADRTVRAKVLD